MNRLLTTLIISLLNCGAFLNSFAQSFIYSDSIIVTVSSGDTLKMAWSGGFNAPQWNSIDLNFDGKKDLVIFDREGNTLKPFINISDNGQTLYRYTPAYIENFPKGMSQFVILKDYNCDGKEDIFTYASGGMKVYKNTSANGNISFEMVSSLLYSQGNSGLINLYVAPTDIPAIEDIDNDGDLDILTYGVLGTTVEYHQNRSMDLYGTCDSLEFVKVTDCWGNFAEGFSSYDITLNISCKGYEYPESPAEIQALAQKHAAHSGSSLLALNLDGDSDKDLIVGDISAKILIALTNGGDSSFADMVSVDTLFPADNPVQMDVFPAGYYVDVDNDNIKDLIVSPNATNTIENYQSAWFFKNNGTDNNPAFQFIQNNFFQSQMLEFGTASFPAVTDINQDGLDDIIVGNYGYYANGSFNGRLAYLQNTGNLQKPKFKLVTDDFMLIGFYNYNALAPAFGDLDGDGDQDMLIGELSGKLHYFENTSGAGNPANYVLASSSYFGIDIGDNPVPQIVDVDNDGLLDLLIGERGGTINFFKNYGTSTTPSFNSTPDNDFFGGIDVMKNCCTGYSVPFLYKTSVDTLLYVGSEFGKIYIYNGISTNPNDTFNLIDSIEIGVNRLAFALSDFNKDNKLEMIVGELGGGLSYYQTPSGLYLISPDSGEVLNHNPKLDWSAVPNVSGYQLQIDTSLNFNSPLLKDTTFAYINTSSYNSDTEYQTYNLMENTVYFWRVRTYTGPSYGNWTSPWSFSIDKSLNITNKKDFEFVVYPNPVSDYLSVKSTDKIKVIYLFNTMGQLVWKSPVLNATSYHISMENLPKEVYFIKINNQIKKVIKM
ncbi:MAG: T9SS C-terminal target domain-containing protein [Bacteroidetes bacterium]|nr:MAG: T9SS C-terminal target domain-containing protein [Bacteroidota bacterium]